MRAFGHIHRKRGAVGAAAHAVVAGAETAADDDGEFRHLGGGDGGDHLGAVAGDAAVFVLAADHEAGDVLQEDERNAALGAEFDEVGAFEGRFAEQDAVVGDDTDRVAVNAGKAADQRRAVARLEFVEIGAVDDAGDDFADVEGLLAVGRDDAVQFFGGEERLDGCGQRHRRGLFPVQILDDAARDGQRVGIVFGQMIDDAGNARMHIGAAEVFGRHDFAGRRLDQRRAAEKDRALVLDDDRLVAHRRHVGAAGRARTHDGGDLRNALRRQVGLVEEDAAEVLLVRENLVLHGQEGAAGIDQIDAGQAVFQGDFLRPQVLS